MTTAELVQRFRQMVAYDFDPMIGLEATDAEVVGVLNEALVEIAAAAYLVDPAVVLTVTPGIGSYLLESPAFGRRVVEPLSVVADGRRLRGASGSCEGEPGLWTIGELNRAYPAWPTDAAGSVGRAVWAGDRLILHPAPSTSILVTVEAQILPPPLNAETPAVGPELAVRLHPAIVQLAVYRTCGINAQQGDQFSRLQAQVSEAMSLAAAMGKRSRASRFGFPTTWAGSQPEFLRV